LEYNEIYNDITVSYYNEFTYLNFFNILTCKKRKEINKIREYKKGEKNKEKRNEQMLNICVAELNILFINETKNVEHENRELAFINLF